MRRGSAGSIGRTATTTVLALTLAATACTSRSPSGTSPVRSDGRTHIVVDTDLGPDDIMALLYLLRRDDVAVDAVTLTGDGLAHCGPGVDNARALLSLGGSPDTPVACGAERPLAGNNAFPPQWRSFADDLTRLRLPSPSPARAGTADAPTLLRDMLTGDVELLTLGPLTNVAAALRAEPALSDRIPVVTSMAGAVAVPGNAPGGLAEYNVWIDPLAAKEVLTALPVTLVPLDATNGVPATPFFLDTLEAHLTTPEATVVDALLKDNPQVASGTYYFWDPLAAVLMNEPSLGTFDATRVMLDTSDTSTAGWMSAWDEGIPVHAATRADALAFEREYLSTITGEAIAKVRPAPDLTLTFDGRHCDVSGPMDVPPGQLIVSFRNTSGADALGVVGTLDSVTYEELLAELGPPGTTITEQPKGIRVLTGIPASAGDPGMAKAQIGPGSLFVACATQNGDAVAVWPGAELTAG